MNIKLQNKTTILGIALLTEMFICVLLQCVLLGIVYQMPKKQTEIPTSVPAAASPMLANDALYRLYECGEKIGIYDAKSGVLIDVIHVFASTLPAQDRKALKKGIDIFSFAELAAIIEDFST